LAAIVDPRSRRAYGDSRRPNRWRGDPGGGGDSQPDWFFFFLRKGSDFIDIELLQPALLLDTPE
jgi:hypothetical protein